MPASLEELKILLVGPIPPPAGGMANQTRQLNQLLSKSGATVIQVAVNRPYFPKFVGRIPFIRAFFRLIPYFFDLIRQTRKVDVVHLMSNSGWSWHLYSTPAILVAHILRTPIVVNYRGGHAEVFFKKSWWLVKLSIRKATHVIVPSDYLKEVFANYGIKAEIVPNILNEDVFYPPSAELPLVSERGPVMLVTRNLELIYDIPTTFYCLKKVRLKYPNARLLVAGTGPEHDKLLKLAESLQITEHVNFLGRLDIHQIAKLYRDSDFLLNASTVDNSPNSVIEALASGIPVVTTNVGGIPKLVTDEIDACLIPPGQPDLMAEKVLYLMANQQQRNMLIERGLSNVRRFFWSNVSQKLLDAYLYAIRKQVEK